MPGRHKQKPWHQMPKVVARVRQVWNFKLRGASTLEIAKEVGYSERTVREDLIRARQLLVLAAAQGIEERKLEAVARREAIILEAGVDRQNADKNDAAGRAALLGVKTKNQDAIEDLEGLRPRGGAMAGVRVRAGPGGLEVEAGVAVGRSLTEDILGDDEATEAMLTLTERLGRRKVEPGGPGDGGKRRALGARRPSKAP